MVQLDIQIGHLHPLLVHLPIGIILFAFLLEVYGRFKSKRHFGEVVEFTLLIGGVFALMSLGTGWLLGSESGYDEDLLFSHRWMAVAFTVATILLYLVKRNRNALIHKAYLPLFVVVLILIGLTGHFGANMTHGEDFLFLEERDEIVITDVKEAAVFAQIIHPILNDKCMSCHNPKKAKGGLVMSTPNDLLLGGDTGSFFDSSLHTNNQALVLNRVYLPLEDEDHMPPKGKIQLTDSEKSLLDWWIKNNNCFECKVKELPAEDKMIAVLRALEQDTSAIAVLAKDAIEVPKQWLQEIRKIGISIHALSEKNHLLIVSLAGMDTITENQLDALDDYADNIVELDLGFTNFNDALMSNILGFENIIKLKLQQTQITDASGVDLLKFERLESLNLYGTKVTDKLTQALKEAKRLQHIYLWGTEVSKDGIAQLQKNLPRLTIQQLNDDMFKATVLDPPTIVAETSFFTDSLVVKMESLFDDSDIYYTLDGSLPNTSSSKLESDIVLKNTATIKAITVKKGWEPSAMNQSTFIKNNITYSAIALLSLPNEKYAGQKGKTLMDQKRGTINFVDGNWLGFEGKHMKALVKLEESQQISKVSIGALSAPASWIFYPTGFIISVSNDGINFKEIGRKNVNVESPNSEVKLTFFEMELPPTTTKYVKLEIQSPLKNPDWHPNPGGKSWIFIDEVVLN